MNYAEYGLDTVKKSQDEGSRGKLWCMWCDRHNLTAGFSMCFSNIIICHDCVQEASSKLPMFKLIGEHRIQYPKRWKNLESAEYAECFKCKKKNIPSGYPTKPPLAELFICESCVQWANETLFKSKLEIIMSTAVEQGVIPLPYKEIEATSRKAWRDNEQVKIGSQSYKIPFEMLKVRPGFNLRTVFDPEEIQSKADDLEANGQIDDLVGDLSTDGKWFYLTDGEMRMRAIALLRKKPGGKDKWALVKVRPNPSDMTEEGRLLYQFSSGNKTLYRPIELAKGAHRLKYSFGRVKSNTEVAKLMGKSRQWVDMMIRLAEQPEEIQQEINAGNLKATNVVADTRTKRKDPEPLAQTTLYPQDQQPEDEEMKEAKREFFAALDDKEEGDEGEFSEPVVVHPPVEHFKLNAGDKVIDEKTSRDSEMSGILPKSKVPTTKDRTIGEGGGSDMMGQASLDSKSEEEHKLDFVITNLNKIEALAPGLNKQAQSDLETYVFHARNKIEEVIEYFHKLSNKRI